MDRPTIQQYYDGWMDNTGKHANFGHTSQWAEWSPVLLCYEREYRTVCESVCAGRDLTACMAGR